MDGRGRDVRRRPTTRSIGHSGKRCPKLTYKMVFAFEVHASSRRTELAKDTRTSFSKS